MNYKHSSLLPKGITLIQMLVPINKMRGLYLPPLHQNGPKVPAASKKKVRGKLAHRTEIVIDFDQELDSALCFQHMQSLDSSRRQVVLSLPFYRLGN